MGMSKRNFSFHERSLVPSSLAVLVVQQFKDSARTTTYASSVTRRFSPEITVISSVRVFIPMFMLFKVRILVQK